MDTKTKTEVVQSAQKIIFGQEGNYGSVNANDNGAVSVGKVQWHAGRALALLKKICAAESGAASILGAALYKEITTAASGAWNARTVNATEKAAISKLLSTDTGKRVQDAQAETDVGTYVDHGLKVGVEDPLALVYFADLENQGGGGASARVAAAAKKPVTLDTLHAAGLADSVMGKYATRRKNVYSAAKKLVWSGTQQKTEGAISMTEMQLRQQVADIISGWVGATKGTAKHLEILSIYNNFKPLARGYKVQVNDAYCATTVSAAFIKAGIAKYTGTECGVEKYTVVAKGLGIWVENDAYVPQIGDAVVYDWQDSGVGDCTGAGDHIGIVTKTGSGSFTVTEGNMTGGKVGTRTMKVNGRYIRGFICPKYGEIAKALGGSASAAPSTPTVSPAPSASAKEVKAKGAATSFDKTMAGTYTVTAGDGLHIRDGAGTGKASLAVLPYGTRVQNYGYFSTVGGVKWLYIQVTHNGVKYTGFSSAEYLRRV